MRTGDIKVFGRDKAKFYQFVNLRLNGIAFETLAALYGVDRTSLQWHCRKYHIKPQVDGIVSLQRILRQVLPKPAPVTYKLVNGERINLGKNYLDYLHAH